MTYSIKKRRQNIVWRFTVLNVEVENGNQYCHNFRKVSNSFKNICLKQLSLLYRLLEDFTVRISCKISGV